MKDVALVVAHAKLIICPDAVMAGVEAKPVSVGCDSPPPLPPLPPLLPLPPPLPLLPLPPLEPELDPPPQAINKLNHTTPASNHA